MYFVSFINIIALMTFKISYRRWQKIDNFVSARIPEIRKYISRNQLIHLRLSRLRFVLIIQFKVFSLLEFCNLCRIVRYFIMSVIDNRCKTCNVGFYKCELKMYKVNMYLMLHHYCIKALCIKINVLNNDKSNYATFQTKIFNQVYVHVYICTYIYIINKNISK